MPLSISLWWLVNMNAVFIMLITFNKFWIRFCYVGWFKCPMMSLFVNLNSCFGFVCACSGIAVSMVMKYADNIVKVRNHFSQLWQCCELFSMNRSKSIHIWALLVWRLLNSPCSVPAQHNSYKPMGGLYMLKPCIVLAYLSLHSSWWLMINWESASHLSLLSGGSRAC